MSLAQQWLMANAYGYSDLTPPEVAAINEFCLLWSFFEEWVLKNDASVAAIKKKVVEAAGRDGELDLVPFEGPIAFFTARYFGGGRFTQNFEGLRFQGKNGGRAEVEAVLNGKERGTVEVLSALLIIVYRLRNNLLHGEKWSYRFRDQFGNFTNANITLMAAMDLFRLKGLFDPEGAKT
jgi:hypothetical protein